MSTMTKPYPTLLHWALAELLGTLPARRDWFNPEAEKVLRDALASPTLGGVELDLRDIGRLFVSARETGKPVTLSASACGVLLDAMTTPPAPVPELAALPRYTYADIAQSMVGKYRDETGHQYVKLADAEAAVQEQAQQARLYRDFTAMAGELGYDCLTDAIDALRASKPVIDPARLLEIARETGLRQHLHGISATSARVLLAEFVAALPQVYTAMIPLSVSRPSPDVYDRVLVYTEGVDFAGEQYFDIKTEDLWPTDPEERDEVAEAATHWMPRPCPPVTTTGSDA